MIKKAGNTPLIRIKKLYKIFGLKNLYIKDESRNPFGTYKDRRSELIIREALRKKLDKLIIITSGNSGYSLARCAEDTPLKVICVIDKNDKNSIKSKLKRCSYMVLETDLLKKKINPIDLIKEIRENEREKIKDVSNGFHSAYINIIREIKDEKPDYIIVPVGSGECFYGLYKGIKRYKLKTKLIGIGVKNKKESFADKLPTIWTPYQSNLNNLCKKGHKIIRLNEREIKIAYNKFKKLINCEPSSAVALGVLYKIKFNKEDKIIIINSGRGVG